MGCLGLGASGDLCRLIAAAEGSVSVTLIARALSGLT